MPPVNLLIKPASGMCNMRCKYCFYYDETEKRQQASYGLMLEKTLKNVIRKTVLVASGSATIAFQGGEPTLCGLPFFKKVVEFVNHYNRNHIHIEYALQTNGYGITQEWCRFFAKNHFLIGISVDGLKEIHDEYRHSSKSFGPTYDRIMETIDMFDRFGVEYNILTVVHRKVARNIKEIYRDYRRRGWNYMQFITCLDPLGEERGKEEYSLLPKDYGQFLIDLFDLWYEDLKKGDQPYIRQFDNYVAMALGYWPESCEQRGTCGIQNVVEADGSVYPCDFYVLDDYCLGNLNDMSLQAIYDKREEIGFISRSQNHPEECKACPWFKLCRGGCYRSRVTEHGDAKCWNYFCEGYKMFFEACYERLLEAAKLAAVRIREKR